MEGFGAITSMLPPPIPLSDTKTEEKETCECCANSSRILQTPSNATELELSSDDISYPTQLTPSQQVSTSVNRKQSIDSKPKSSSSDGGVKVELANRELKEVAEQQTPDVVVINLPIPKSSKIDQLFGSRPGFVPSLFVGITDHYISDMVLQVRRKY